MAEMSKVAPTPQANEDKSDPAVILRAQAIRKSYQMGDTPLVILKHVDLSLRKGEFVAIEGRSGSGKSTLLHILCGLDAADAGTLQFRGKEYAANPPGMLFPTPFRRVLLVPQKFRMRICIAIIAVILFAAEVSGVLGTSKVLRYTDAIIPLLWVGASYGLKWERRILGSAVAVLVLAMGWMSAIAIGSFSIGLAVGTCIVIAFFIYLVVAGYIAERPVCQLRNTEFGFVFQFYHLLPELNVLENAMMATMVEQSWFSFRLNKAEIKARATAILTDLGLDNRLTHKPNQLSGGERQRVAIARALMNGPKVLFADEPTGNLDYETGRQIMGVLEKLHQEKGQTIVMVTHDRSLASEADRVLVLRNGKLEKPGEAPTPDKTGMLDYH
ncbi:MAG TPA: ABC transporter ATP-binding protein [Tepidisphaeraceae bacterium]|nr:ABC transporter ATP-binding protein [Tepidisphaeraceae bacterium]